MWFHFLQLRSALNISSALRQVVHGTRWHAKRKSYKVLFWREITPLAVPIFMENACVLLMGVLSTFLVSWLGKDAMAGVGLADSFNMVIMAFFAAIDLGTTVVVAFSLGKRDRRRARVATRQSLVIMTLFAVLLATLIHHFGEQIIDFVAGDATTEVKALALTYLELNGKVTALFVDGKAVDAINAGQEAVVVLDQTPFYAESGGQVGDKGELKGANFSFAVEDTQKYGQAIGHIGKLAAGSLKVGDAVQADVDEARRARIRLNHSATHLMHAALRQVLGTHVSQKGSLVNDKVLRFDFSHNEAMKPEEIRAVEDLVNTQIRRNLPIETNIMDLEAAKAKGAMALFGEKYDERVRVLSMGDFSTELCGGTHASRTGDIGLFRIISESGTAAGVRRIEAVTGEGAIATVHADSDRLSEVAHLLKGDSNNLADKVRSVLERTRQLEKELQQLKEQAAAQESANLSSKAIDVNGVKLLVSELSGVEPKMLRTMVDDLKNQLGSTIIVLATVVEGKVSLIAGVSKDVTDRVKAGELIGMVAQQVGGKGGGRPDMAQAGGTDAAALPAALASVKGWVSAKLQ